MASVNESVSSTAAAVSTMVFVWAVTGSSTALATSALTAGLTNSYISAAAAVSTVSETSHATLQSNGVAVGTCTPTIAVSATKYSYSEATSTLFVAIANYEVSTAAAVDTAAYGADLTTYVSTGAATSSIAANTAATTTLHSVVAATSATTIGLLEAITTSAAAVGTPTFYNLASSSCTSMGAATSTTTYAGSYKAAALVSTAAGTSVVTNNVIMTAYVQSLADIGSTATYRDPLQGAYVMNTETAALSQYTNFAFNSVAYMNGKLYATSQDGFYVLEGANDDGVNTDAYIESGYSDLGEQHTKHAGSLYFGYTSDGPVGVDVETYGSGHAKQSYELEMRDATSPRNNRVKLGKGLSSRHWRITVKNIDGSHFELNDMAIDVAVSQRRI